MEVKNPFFINNYYSPEYFCNRELEIKRLSESAENHRNVTIFSPRKLGKTGLIKHFFYLKNIKNEYNSFYFDIYYTQNLNDFISEFSKAVLGKLDSTPARIIKKVGGFFSSLTPVFTYDAISGTPEVNFKLSNENDAVKTLAQIFDYLRMQGKQIIIAIDEFQQILNYPEKNIEALMRAQVQQTANVNFIFSGSHKHMLMSIFANHAKPFYQSTEMLELKPIETDKYSAFIADKMALGKKTIDDEGLESVLNYTRTHTYYVQYLCNRLYASEFKKITPREVEIVLGRVLLENEGVYANYRNLLTTQQWNVLRAIAKEDGVMQAMSKDFIQKYKLNATSTVQTALASLIDKEMAWQDESGKYLVYDVFFSRWLEKH